MLGYELTKKKRPEGKRKLDLTPVVHAMAEGMVDHDEPGRFAALDKNSQRLIKQDILELLTPAIPVLLEQMQAELVR